MIRRRTFLSGLFSHRRGTVPEPRFRGRKRVRETIGIREPGTYDFGDILHTWEGEEWPRDREYGPPVLHVFTSNVTIRNFAFAGAPDGIHVGALPWTPANAVRHAPGVENVRFENLQAIDIREDALTLQRGTRNVSLQRCRFWGARDKVVQNDHCTGLRVDRCAFYGGMRPLRFKARTSGTVTRCRFVKNGQGIKADGLAWPAGARGTRRRPGGTTHLRVEGCLFFQSSIAAIDLGRGTKLAHGGNTFLECHRDIRKK